MPNTPERTHKVLKAENAQLKAENERLEQIIYDLRKQLAPLIDEQQARTSRNYIRNFQADYRRKTSVQPASRQRHDYYDDD